MKEKLNRRDLLHAYHVYVPQHVRQLRGNVHCAVAHGISSGMHAIKQSLEPVPKHPDMKCTAHSMKCKSVYA